ncbi:hypothetical protein NQ314_011910 [Rhamnusium bicolor]|uniref:Uncharacterized protein n=1 Tax=Rhamnusium bicolor TaxID=1586634 RepID=A0AAV8XFX9_9CUCU|nr:hypothetical protein NQ314_011910 [Rhamnusium bicolor]
MISYKSPKLQTNLFYTTPAPIVMKPCTRFNSVQTNLKINPIEDNSLGKQFVIKLDGERSATINYEKLSDNTYDLVHSSIPEEYQGLGLGRILAELYNHMLNASKEGISKFKSDVSFHLHHSLALILVNRLEEGIHDLETIRMENDVKLAVTIALMYSHKLLGVSNKDLFVKLDGQMREYQKALDYAEKALNMQSSLSECLTLKGWILLQLRKNGKRAAINIKDIFQNSLQQNPRNLDTIIGLTECHLLQNDFTEALNIINKAVVRYTSANLPLLQKLRIQLAALEWDQAIETIHRINGSDSKNFYTRKLFIIILICRSANYEEAVIEIKKFIQLLETSESGNVHLMLETAQLFSRICSKNSEILLETKRMLDLAVQNNPENAEVVVELGYQALLGGKTKEALRCFRSATRIDDTSLTALLGLSLCELRENGNSEQLQKQVQFLLEMKDAQDSLLLHFIQAKISDTSEEALKYLKMICEVKLSQLVSCPFSDSYLLSLDLDFMLDVVKESMQHMSVSKSASDSIYEVLNVIVKVCPGVSEALLLLAKLQYIKGDNTNSMNTLEKLLINMTSPQSEAQLFMAQIQVQHGLFDRAAQSLEVCVSHNFKVRENPMYHFITALVDKNTSNYADAIKSLTTALSLVNIKSKDNLQSDISLVERASIYVELIDTLNIVGQADEATKILEDATEELQGTPEEARILLLSAEHLLKRKNIQGAVDLLKPDDALESYEKALKENPKDPLLTSKMGKALVDTHYFSRAVNYYKEAIQNTNDSELKLQLAELYMNLKEFEKGELLLLNELEEENVNNLEDLTYLQYKARLLNLLSQIQEKSGNTVYAMKSLKDAMDNQNRVPINYYKEGLEVSPNNASVMVALAKLYMQMNYLELCQQTSANILRIEPENETASVMMADIAFRKWYSGNLNGALRNFNNARQDPELGQMAIYNMIEICLNPDDEMLGEQFMDTDDIEYRDSRSMALKTELKQRLEANGDEILKYRLLSNFRLLATKEKFNIERALDDFVSVASDNAYKDNIGTTLGIATAYTLLKQGQRAKNQLKRIVKSTWTFEDAEYLERCWLLLADYYLQSAKFDIATELINKVVQHNKACTKAYEYLGYIAEKEQRYKDAVNHYEQTWKFGGKSNPTIGFKLAFCLMKCKKYPDTIDVAQEVLKLNPEYPRVKKDILDKCMNNLRI